MAATPMIVNDFSPDSVYRIYGPSHPLPFCPTGAGHFFAGQNYLVRRESWDMALLLLTVSGSGHITCGARSITLEPGQAVLLNGVQPHSYRTAPFTNGWEFKWLRLPAADISEYDLLLNNGECHPVTLQEPELLSVWDTCSRLIADPDPLKDFRLTELVCRLLTGLCTSMGETGSGTIEDCCRYLSQHYIYQIRLEQLADRACMTVPSFIRKFRQHTGISPYAYLQRLRIDKASELLEFSQLSIRQIAAATGFDDQNNFSKQFRHLTGLSPSDYRRQMRP